MDESSGQAFSRPPIFFIELVLWLTVISAAIFSASSAYGGGGLHAGDDDYMWSYFALSLALSPILAGILAFSLRSRLHGTQLRLAAVALPAFLLAVLLHIAAWGVSASRWLVYLQPKIGTALWTFVNLATPLCLAISATFAYKLRRATRSSAATLNPDPPEPPRPPRHQLRTIWFIVLSVIFLVQFVVIAIGAWLTAVDLRYSWFSPDMSNLTHVTVIVSTLLLIGVLVSSALVSGRRVTGAGKNPGNKKTLPTLPSKVSWNVVLGPLIVCLILLVVSASSLVFSGILSGEPRWNTGVVLFVAYSSSLVPSYVIISVLHLIGRIELHGQHVHKEPKRSAIVES